MVKLRHKLGKLRAMKREQDVEQEKMYVSSDDSDICLTQVKPAPTKRRQ